MSRRNDETGLFYPWGFILPAVALPHFVRRRIRDLETVVLDNPSVGILVLVRECLEIG